MFASVLDLMHIIKTVTRKAGAADPPFFCSLSPVQDDERSRSEANNDKVRPKLQRKITASSLYQKDIYFLLTPPACFHCI